MLGRYRIVRGKRPADEPLPEGVRVDTRKHTRHVLRPTAELVSALLDDVEAGWPAFREAYLALLRERFEQDPAPFEELARQARRGDVYLGCNCPTKRQPDVRRCHTVLALGFVHERFPDLAITWP